MSGNDAGASGVTAVATRISNAAASASPAVTATTANPADLLASGAPPELAALLRDDPHLGPYVPALSARYRRYAEVLARLEAREGGLLAFAGSYKRFGLYRDAGAGKGGARALRLREWLPNARAVSVYGAWCDWNVDAHVCERDEYGVWTCLLPDAPDGSPAVPDGAVYKLSVVTATGERVDRLPAWARRAVANPDTNVYEARHVEASSEGKEMVAGGSCFDDHEAVSAYAWQYPRPATSRSLRIYEAHVGISSPEPRVASYREFADTVVPRIAALGYTTVQLMAVQEHAYYGSFGYQVTSFFAPASRSGSPKDLAYLVDTCHGAGLTVLLDVVHSHASSNTADGLNAYDGSDSCYFHSGGRGHHPQWNSRLFDYASWEVLRFLLSNLRYWLEEFRFDGFRFDGVTSMLYLHHGIGRVFGGYEDYYDGAVDIDACVYLMLANTLAHTLLEGDESRVITVAEEVSGMPALCRAPIEGGFGFDYRLGMAIPDMWIKLLKEVKDEDWNMGAIAWELENRRHDEQTIAYCESHDQALVGDKTIAFRLMDAEMYTHMSVLSERTPVIDRGLALHKMIRLITMGLGGEGYLGFMGNEFGHPEWLDFPRAGNGESFHYARRQWDLVDDDLLRYKLLNNFDAAMQTLEATCGFLMAGPGYVTLKHEDDKLIVFERGELLFVFNFNVAKSFSDYRLGTARPGTHTVALSSDDAAFGGHSRVVAGGEYHTDNTAWHDRNHSFLAYLPSRAAIVFRRVA